MNRKRLSAKLLKCGMKKVLFDETKLKEIEESITAGDVRSLIKTGAISKKRVNNQSRAGARAIRKKKKKNQRRGAGTRRGSRTARLPRKEGWMLRIRSQRKLLAALKSTGKLDTATYRTLYGKAKGGFFRSRRHLQLYIEERRLLKP